MSLAVELPSLWRPPPALWLEPSGSVVWDALGGEAQGVLLSNAFPWHRRQARTQQVSLEEISDG